MPYDHEALRHCLGAGGRCGTYFAFREFRSKAPAFDGHRAGSAATLQGPKAPLVPRFT